MGSSPANQPRRKLAAPERRRQLVSIAMDLIAAKGFEGLRFQEVAEAAGINNATLAYHFANKEALITGVMSSMAEELSKTPDRPPNGPQNALDELRLEFSSMVELLRNRPRLFLVITELSMRAMRDPTMGTLVDTLDGYWRQHLSEVIRLGKSEGVFRPDIDVDSMAVALMAQMKGIGFHALVGRLKPEEVERCVAQIAAQTERWLTHG
jgi:AcrR family transcriptional regulator